MTGSDKRAVTWTLCRSIFRFTWRLCSRSSRISLYSLKFIIQVPQKNMLSVSASAPTPIESQCGQNVRGIILLCFGLKGISWTSTVLIYSPFLWENLLMTENPGCCEYTLSFSEQVQKTRPLPMRRVPWGRGLPLQLCRAPGTGWEGTFLDASAMASQRRRRKCSTHALGLSTGCSYI